MKKWWNINICMLEEGTGFVLAKNVQKSWKNVSCEVHFGEKRQLGWEPHVASGGVGAVYYFSGLQCKVANSYPPIPCNFSSSTSYFLHEFTQMLNCKFVKFAKSQPQILNYQILNNCRVLYTSKKSGMICRRSNARQRETLYVGYIRVSIYPL